MVSLMVWDVVRTRAMSSTAYYPAKWTAFRARAWRGAWTLLFMIYLLSMWLHVSGSREMANLDILRTKADFTPKSIPGLRRRPHLMSCPVRALSCYVGQTAALCSSQHLFVHYREHSQGLHIYTLHILAVCSDFTG